jgi:hypothetical protein
VTLLERVTWPELMELLADDGRESVLKVVRTAENADPSLRTWPRAKASDDATAAYLRF